MLNVIRNGGMGIALWLLLLLWWLAVGLLIRAAYWFSDALYGAGLWPLGTLLRIFLLSGILFWFLYGLYLAGMLVIIPISIFSGRDD